MSLRVEGMSGSILCPGPRRKQITATFSQDNLKIAHCWNPVSYCFDDEIHPHPVSATSSSRAGRVCFVAGAKSGATSLSRRMLIPLRTISH